MQSFSQHHNIRLSRTYNFPHLTSLPSLKYLIVPTLFIFTLATSLPSTTPSVAPSENSHLLHLNTSPTLLAHSDSARAAAEAGQWGHILEHVHAQAVAPRDNDCTGLPKLCTDAVLLRGYETTLTYLCPETEGPSTVTVTMTATTTVTPGQDVTSSAPATVTSNIPSILTSDIPVIVTSHVQGSTSEEPTTTVTIQSTAQITITRVVTRIATSSSPSLLPPPTITWSFTAVLPSDVKPPPAPRMSSSTLPDGIPSIVSSVGTPTSSARSSFELFPSHSVSNWSSIAIVSSVGYHAPPFANRTALRYTHGDFPTLNVARNTNPTNTVTTTAAVVTETKKAQAGDTQASFIALFFGVLAATLLI
jgi:hypothetical protein